MSSRLSKVRVARFQYLKETKGDAQEALVFGMRRAVSKRVVEGKNEEAFIYKEYHVLVRPFEVHVWARCLPMISGLSDPQVPTIVEVVQEDESLREEYSRLFPNTSPGTPITTPKLVANHQNLIFRPPSMYTGLMRGLVQDQLGRGLQVGWDPTFNRTNGILAGSKGGYWAIQISSAGVRASRLKPCGGELFGAEATVPGFTTPQAFFPLSGWTELAPANVVGDAYTKTGAIWPECGWAFSASGKKAANIVLSVEGNYFKSHLYEILITENDEGVPVNATMSELEDGFFWGDRVSHIRFPRYAAPMSLVSFDWFNGIHDPPAESFVSPVHVHYVGEEQRVVRYVFSRADTSVGDLTRFEGEKGFQSEVFDTVVSYIEASGPQELNRFVALPANWMARPGGNQFYTEVAFRYWYGLQAHQTGTIDYTELDIVGNDVLTFPFWDREGYYHVRLHRDGASGTETATATVTATRGSKNAFLGQNAIKGARAWACPEQIGVPGDYILDDAGTLVVGIVYENHEVFDPPVGPVFPFIGEFMEAPEVGDPMYRSSGSCSTAIFGADRDAVGEQWFNEVSGFDPSQNVFHDLLANPGSFTAGDWPRRHDYWIVRRRQLSDDTIHNTSGQVQREPGIWVKPTDVTTTTAVAEEHTYSNQPFSFEERSFEGGVYVAGESIELPMDEATWEEFRIYDASAQTQQRILLAAVDAADTAFRIYSRGVFPQQGPIGTLLEGGGPYPIGQLTSIHPAWIGLPEPDLE